MSVGNLEEIIDDNHAIVSSSVGPEYYVNIMSFVDKDLLEPGCSVLLHHKVRHARPESARFFMYRTQNLCLPAPIYKMCGNVGTLF
jgi:hypothetical protein